MSEHKSVGKYISIINRQFQKYIARELKPYDISGSEYMFIVNIPDDSPINQRQLCSEFLLDEAVATRAMKSLTKKGLVQRYKNPDDKREYVVSLTEKGKEIKPIIIERLRHWTEILLQGMDQNKRELVFNSLVECSENAVVEIQKENNDEK